MTDTGLTDEIIESQFNSLKIEIVKVMPSDVIFINSKENLNDCQLESINGYLKKAFPSNYVMLLDGDVNIKFIRNPTKRKGRYKWRK